LSLFSKCALKSLNNQTDFDSAIRRFDPSRPSQPPTQLKIVLALRAKSRHFAGFSRVPD